MRILATIEAESISGAAKAVVEFGRECARHPTEFNVQLSIMKFCRGEQQENALTQVIRELGLDLHLIHETGPFDTKVIPQMRKVVLEQQPDVLWTHNVKSHFLTRWSGLHKQVHWVAFHHGYTWTDTKMQMYNQLDRWSLRAPDRVLTVCQPFATELRSKGVPADRITVQHMPVRPFTPVSPNKIEELRARLNLGSEQKVLLSVGRLSKEKGHADLLHAFGEIRKKWPSHSVRLIFVGEGPERTRLEELCQELNISSDVTWAGQQGDVGPFYALANVFVLPSHTEGSPNVLLEALAAGVPAVTTAVGGVPELVSHREQALLTPAGDTAQLAKAVIEVLEDEALRDRLVAAGLARAAEKTPKAYVQTVISVFDKAVQGPLTSA